MALLITKKCINCDMCEIKKNTFIFIVIQQCVIECVVGFMVQKNFA